MMSHDGWSGIELCPQIGEYVYVKTPKPVKERVAALRAARVALGLKRRELYVHDADWPRVQELAARLAAKRKGK